MFVAAASDLDTKEVLAFVDDDFGLATELYSLHPGHHHPRMDDLAIVGARVILRWTNQRG
jgi:hypothetical protein